LQTGLYIKVIFQRVHKVHGFLLGVADTVIPSLTASFSSFFNRQFTELLIAMCTLLKVSTHKTTSWRSHKIHLLTLCIITSYVVIVGIFDKLQ